MSKKDGLLRLNLQRATEIRDGKQDDSSPDSIPGSPSSLSKSGILKSPKDRTKASARAHRTSSVQFNLESGKSSPTKADAEEEVIVSSPIPQDLGDNKKLRNFFGLDDLPGSPGASPRTSPKLSRSESSFRNGSDSPGKKKRAASTSVSLETTSSKSPKMVISSSEPDLAISTSTNSASSTPRKASPSPRHSTSFSMYPGDSPSRRATVHITASPSPLATMPFLNPNGTIEGHILTKTKKQGWKKIWIRTEGSVLMVYKDRADAKPSKQFDLKNAYIKYGELQDNTLSIQISLGDGRMLLFSADSDSNVTVWCNLLNDVIQRNSAAKQRRRTSQIPIELLELLTEEVNSHCAECSAEPAEVASVALGAFVCKDCATLHCALEPAISTFVVLSSAIDWTPAAIKFMRDVGNKAHNEFWEKEIPSGITKPTPTSTLEEKKQWVLTKYVARSMTGSVAPEEITKRIRPVQLPTQFVDENGMLTPQQKESSRAKSSSDFNIPVLLDSARRKKLRSKDFNVSPVSTPHTPSTPQKVSPNSQPATIASVPSGQGQASGLVAGGGSYDSFLRSTDLLKEALLHMLQDTEFRRDLKSILLEDTKKE